MSRKRLRNKTSLANRMTIGLFDFSNRSSYRSKRKKIRLLKSYSKFLNSLPKKYYTIFRYYHLVGIVLIILSFYVVFFSSYFKIKKIIIERKDITTNIKRVDKAVQDFYFKPIFSIYNNNIEKNIISFQ